MEKSLRLLLAWMVSVPLFVSGQNMLPNPSFESTNSYPCNWLTSAAAFNNTVNGWTQPSGGSTDVFSTYVSSTCYAHPMSSHGSSPGNQMPRTGNVMLAILTYGEGCGWQPNYREYIQAQLNTPMIAGQSYDIEFYVSLGDNSRYGTNNIGAHFRTGNYYNGTCYTLNLPAQFNHTTPVTNASGWQLISGTVTATANWNHVLIGNFRSNAQTTTSFHGGARTNTRYFIDDISLTSAVILSSAEIALVGERDQAGAIDLDWQMTGNEDVREFRIQRSADGGLNWNTLAVDGPEGRHFKDEFPPLGTLQYRVRYRDQNGTDYTSETVEIGPGAFPYRVEVAPHPVVAGQPLRLRVAHGDASPVKMEVFDVQGRKVWERDGLQMDGLDGFQSDRGFETGVYVLKLSTNKGVWTEKFLVQAGF